MVTRPFNPPRELDPCAVSGDVLTAIDGEPVTDPLSLNVVMNRKRPGDVVTVTLYRGREKMEMKVTLGEM